MSQKNKADNLAQKNKVYNLAQKIFSKDNEWKKDSYEDPNFKSILALLKSVDSKLGKLEDFNYNSYAQEEAEQLIEVIYEFTNKTSNKIFGILKNENSLLEYLPSYQKLLKYILNVKYKNPESFEIELNDYVEEYKKFQRGCDFNRKREEENKKDAIIKNLKKYSSLYITTYKKIRLTDSPELVLKNSICILKMGIWCCCQISSKSFSSFNGYNSEERLFYLRLLNEIVRKQISKFKKKVKQKKYSLNIQFLLYLIKIVEIRALRMKIEINNVLLEFIRKEDIFKKNIEPENLYDLNEEIKDTKEGIREFIKKIDIQYSKTSNLKKEQIKQRENYIKKLIDSLRELAKRDLYSNKYQHLRGIYLAIYISKIEFRKKKPLYYVKQFFKNNEEIEKIDSEEKKIEKMNKYSQSFKYVFLSELISLHMRRETNQVKEFVLFAELERNLAEFSKDLLINFSGEKTFEIGVNFYEGILNNFKEKVMQNLKNKTS